MPLVRPGETPDPSATTYSPPPSDPIEPARRSGGRDFDAEARGKVACAAFNAALGSQGLATLPFKTVEEFLIHVRRAADAAVAYTWEKQNEVK